MKPGIVYVWSSGLEEWEETSYIFGLQYITIMNLVYKFSKTMGQGQLHVYKDELNNYIGTYSELK